MPTSVTKSVVLPVPAYVAFQFLASVENWPQWAIHNVKRAQIRDEHTWEIETPRGNGQIVLRVDAKLGILDHDFIDGQGNTWTVPARVVSVPNGSVFMMTFSRPPTMPDEVFEQGMRDIEDELRELSNRLIES